ncbi:MAG: sodium:alanine symporter family protein [Synergistaceae bacterium]|jgi:AGCS family alanine or glycine:cation symporter|nr:sodium:alanine symporter family protein [Synergistaceae bacterium]
METVMILNEVIHKYVWGGPMLVLLVGTGVYLTFLLRVPQFRYFGAVWREIFGKREREKGSGISSFGAMATAVAATVGTGNIAGVATALHLGGPGALVWMLISALFGMCTKFGEVALAVHFRKKDENGHWRGGTMYILEHGAGQKWLAVLFAICAFLASFGIGAAVQANSTAEGLQMGFGLDPLWSGIGLAFLTGLVIVGGIRSLATVTTYLVPFMALFYIAGASIVLVRNAAMIPAGIAWAVRSAFGDPAAVPGALAGWTVMEAVRKGVARGVFSNEAGLGSAPMAHAAADVDHPVRQGLYGIFEVFMDTFVLCSMTALVILTTGTLSADGAGLTGSALSLYAFEIGLGSMGKVILSIGLSLFAFTTILGWYWYAETAATYLLGTWFTPVMKILWIVLILLGASGSRILGTDAEAFLASLWNLADTLNGLMAIPNLIGLLLLSGVLRKLVAEFDARRKTGEIEL